MEYYRKCPLCGSYMIPEVSTGTSGTTWSCLCGYRDPAVIVMTANGTTPYVKEPITGIIPKDKSVTECKHCVNHRDRSGYCDVWHEYTPADGYCFRAVKKMSEKFSKEANL